MQDIPCTSNLHQGMVSNASNSEESVQHDVSEEALISCMIENVLVRNLDLNFHFSATKKPQKL